MVSQLAAAFNNPTFLEGLITLSGIHQDSPGGTQRFSMADHRSDAWRQGNGMMDFLPILNEIGPPCTGLKARLGLSSLAENELQTESDLMRLLRIAKLRSPGKQARE
jgi:hypothetical protein